MSEGELQKKFAEEVVKSLLLSEEDKQYWLNNVSKLPKEVLEQVYKIVKGKNDLMEEYMKIAMKNDPSLITQLQEAVKKVKRETLQIKEKEQAPDAEKILEQNLDNL